HSAGDGGRTHLTGDFVCYSQRIAPYERHRAHGPELSGLLLTRQVASVSHPFGLWRQVVKSPAGMSLRAGSATGGPPSRLPCRFTITIAVAGYAGRQTSGGRF